MNTTRRNKFAPRAADIWGLAFAAARQQKVRTALTIIGVAVGTFALVLSLAVGQGVDRAVLALFHQDDRLRKFSVRPNYQTRAQDVPKAEREPEGPMSQAKRERMRRALVRNWRGVADRVDRVRLDRAGLDRIETLDHVVRVEPVIQLFGKASLEAKRQHDASAASTPAGSRYFADRLLAGRLFEPGDGREAMVHEYLLYRWGMVDDRAAEAALGRTLRLEFRSMAPNTLNLTWTLSAIGAIAADKMPALESGLRRLAAVVPFLPIPRDERAALRILFDRVSTTSSTTTEHTFAETFTIVGVVRERDENDDHSRVSPFGEWPLQDVGIALPAAAAAELFLRGPTEAKEGFNEVVVTVDDEEHVQDVANRTAKIGYEVYSLAGILRTIRLNVRLVTFAMASVAVVALAVAAIGITNTMIMSVLERTHEIGIIKALGARERDVRRIFLVEGMLVGLIGSALGLLLGWLASYPGDAIATHILSAVNESALKGTLFIYPGWLLIGVPATICVITTLAALYPASRAAKVDPVTSLRHE